MRSLWRMLLVILLYWRHRLMYRGHESVAPALSACAGARKRFSCTALCELVSCQLAALQPTKKGCPPTSRCSAIDQAYVPAARSRRGQQKRARLTARSPRSRRACASR